MDEDTTTVKKPVRTRKITKATEADDSMSDTPTSKITTSIPSLTDSFNNLISQITQSKQELENLQKEIEQTKKLWKQEQQGHEVTRQREQETYQYNLNLTRKRAEDEFSDKKSAWEKELSGRKEQLEKDIQELESLRKQAAEFDSRVEQTVRKAEEDLKSNLASEFEAENKLREQEVKSEKEILGLKIESLTSEVKRQSEEIIILKRSLDQAQEQVKQIAVKVIEAGGSQSKTPQDG